MKAIHYIIHENSSGWFSHGHALNFFHCVVCAFLEIANSTLFEGGGGGGRGRRLSRTLENFIEIKLSSLMGGTLLLLVIRTPFSIKHLASCNKWPNSHKCSI